jgi:hypothetical protein
MSHISRQLGLVAWVAVIGAAAIFGFGSIGLPVQLGLAYGLSALVLAWIFWGLFHGFAPGSIPTLFGLPTARPDRPNAPMRPARRRSPIKIASSADENLKGPSRPR